MIDSISMVHLTSALIWITVILTTGGIILLRPLVKQLGRYLEYLSEGGNQNEFPGHQEDRLIQLLERFDERLTRVEAEREFDRKLSSSSSEPGSLPGGAGQVD